MGNDNTRIALKHCKVAQKHFSNDKSNSWYEDGMSALRKAIKKLENIK